MNFPQTLGVFMYFPLPVRKFERSEDDSSLLKGSDFTFIQSFRLMGEADKANFHCALDRITPAKL